MIIIVPVRPNLITNILSVRIMIFFPMFIVICWTGILLFTTLHDSSVAMILANSHLIEYVSDEIDSLSDKLHLKFTSIVDSKLLQWTDSKVALVEFIYAIYAGKCFNNGNTSLKDIAFCCEILFNIEIGDFIVSSWKLGIGRRAGHNFLIS